MKTLGPVIALLVVVAACGSSGKDLAEAPPTTSTTVVVEEGATYPPNDATQLSDIVNPLVEPLGLRFTYGSLNDTSDGGYEPSDTGNHLALYVEPIGEYTDEDYLDGLYTVTAAVTPYVFETWSGLTSYDICQEPRPEEDDSERPPPTTQVNIEREAGESFDWENGDLESMLRHAFEVGGEEFSIVVAAPINSVPRFIELSEEIFG